MVYTGHGRAQRQGQTTAAMGLVVRGCASFGVPWCGRVACHLPAACGRLPAVVAEGPAAYAS